MNVYKMHILQRMVLTALMLAIYIIATRFLGIYVTPYVRLSLGVSIIIFSSILLGPISGAVIGGAGDILGILLWNTSGVAINPIMPISYALMGAVPALLMILFRKVKHQEKLWVIIFNSLLALIGIALTIFMALSPSITLFDHVFTIDLLAKILVPIIAFILLGGLAFLAYIFDRQFKKHHDDNLELVKPYQVAFIVLIVEVVFTLIINSLIKSWFYPEINFDVIFFPALFLAFIYIPGNTVIVTYLCLLASKTIKIRE